MDRLQFDGPVVLAIMDGVGLAPDGAGNAVSKARTAFLGHAAREHLHIALQASGEAVGLVPGQMGNSEVGHNTIGSGQIKKQGIARIEEAFLTGEIYQSRGWRGAMEQILGTSEYSSHDIISGDNGNAENRDLGASQVNGPMANAAGKASSATLHFSGIFSDGGVHSHISHLEKLIKKAYESGVRKMRIHAIFDGRDVAPQSEPKFIQRFETFAQQFSDADIKIASGGGRMTTVSDRYENDWGMVERGFKMMVDGKAENYFHSAEEAIRVFREKNPTIQDQDLPSFVVVDDNENPVGKIEKGDALIYFDFRADRAIEISMAFTYENFPYFNRGNYSPHDIFFAGLTEYNSDTHVPEFRLVEPIEIKNTLHEFLGQKGTKELAVTETVKFGHLTYYFNGNSYEKAPGEEFIEIPSSTEPFETRPWMRSAEITDEVLKNLENYKFLRLNFPGGDMVGHTADMEATITAMEAIDLSLKRIAEKLNELGGVLIITADHGNAEELLSPDGTLKTAHSTNLVPCIIYDNTENRGKYQLKNIKNPGLSNLAATIAMLLGQNDFPESWQQSLIELQPKPSDRTPESSDQTPKSSDQTPGPSSQTPNPLSQPKHPNKH